MLWHGSQYIPYLQVLAGRNREKSPRVECVRERVLMRAVTVLKTKRRCAPMTVPLPTQVLPWSRQAGYVIDEPSDEVGRT